ncbi:hypothetical protein HPB47_003570 [Ixodes persulcatus]|uniref:Uncharacterized protein n=1 Tax=Ixodes persulcatus TaxID=34615 RepID=A0AC60PJ53_IXOPE|nr:hypothetical protein HPB47_003570 [Ixodes persulcatus]
MDLSQQSPAEDDHNYHVIQGNLTGSSALRKRPNDIDGNSPESSLTPAKVPAGANDAMDQGFTEGDLEGFILVEHRRQRTSGVLYKTHRLQQQNPLILSTQVNTAAGGPIIRHRFTARGGLLVEVAGATSVNKLLQVRCLGDIPIQVTIPSAYLQNYGLIKAVPTWYTNAELREYLEPEGVIAARRLYRRRGKPGDAASPSDRVVLTFRPNTERPTKDDPPPLSSFPPLDVLQESSTSTAPQQQVQQRTPRKAKPKHTPPNNKQGELQRHQELLRHLHLNATSSLTRTQIPRLGPQGSHYSQRLD